MGTCQEPWDLCIPRGNLLIRSVGEPQPIHLGFRLGTNHLRAYLKSLEEIGVNHVALNLRFNQIDTEETMKRLADDILPEFPGPDIAA